MPFKVEVGPPPDRRIHQAQQCVTNPDGQVDWPFE